MNTHTVRNGQRFVYGLAALGAVVLVGIGTFATPAKACETVSYTVTGDNGTALEMGIEYRDNVDYEEDATQRMNPAGTDTLCERLARRSPTDGYLLTWYECDDVPRDEIPS